MMAQVDTTHMSAVVEQATPRPFRAPSISNERALEALDKVASAKTATQEVLASVQEVEAAIETVNSAFERADVALRFVMDDVIDRPIVSVVDRESGQLLRQLPSEEVLRAARNIESMKGILLSTKG